MAVAAAGLALLLSAALLMRFVTHERAGRRLPVVLWLLGLVLVESLVWPSPNDVPAGIAHPDLGPTNFRLVDTVALAALAGVLVGRGMPARISAAGLWWLAFLGWTLVSAARGVLLGNDVVTIVFQAKVVVYLGLMLVAAGVRREEWRAPAVDRFLVASGVAAAVVVVLDQAGLSLDVALPLVPLEQFGEVGSDAATLATSLGLLCLLRTLTQERSRTALLLAAAPLLLTPFVAGQRAALLGLAIGLLVSAVLVLRAGRSLRLPGGAVVVSLAVVVGLLTTPVAVASALGRPLSLPVVETVAQTIDSRGKQLSAEGRINQWREVRPMLADKPVLGWGLGHEYRYYEPGPKEHVTTALTHNVAGDLLLRSGLVGLLLFGAAFATTMLAALRAAARGVEPLVAGLAVAAAAVLAGWMAKGLVESLFEKYRLAVLLGLAVGMVLSLDPAGVRAEDSEDERGPLRDAERTGSPR
jgi:O-antigen ligase